MNPDILTPRFTAALQRHHANCSKTNSERPKPNHPLSEALCAVNESVNVDGEATANATVNAYRVLSPRHVHTPGQQRLGYAIFAVEDRTERNNIPGTSYTYTLRVAG